jgi:protein-tyrosine phosphatase
MSHPFDIFPLDNGAAFIFTPCPGTKQVELKTALEQLAAAGATAVLTLMESEEMQRNQVTDLPRFCTELNLQWFHLPIEDDHAPQQEFATAWQAARDNIHALLDSGKTIAIHCKGGSGRTGLVAGQILLERGMHLDTVIEKIRALRPNSLQVPAHQTYIKTIAGN